MKLSKKQFGEIEPLQFFTIEGKGGDAYFMKTGEHEAICLSSQHYRYKRGEYDYFKLTEIIIPE